MKNNRGEYAVIGCQGILMMNIKQKLLMASCISAIGLSQSVMAAPLKLCVFDVMGANGITMLLARDYALFAQQQGVDIELKSYQKLDATMADFDQKKCDGVVADNFATRKYNVFMGTMGAVGAINDNNIAQRVITALGSPKLAHKMNHNGYEVVGYMPYGLAYFMSRNRELRKLEQIVGLRVGVLAEDPSQRRMAQKVGMKPVIMTFDNATTKFKNNDFDVVPAPLIVYEPFEIGKLLGNEGGIVNYPLAFMTMNFVFHQGKYQEGFGQQSREWFSKQSAQMMNAMKRWESKVPARMWVSIPEIDRTGYDRLVSQMRREFIANGVYDTSMITLIRHLRCRTDQQFIECKK